MLTTTPPDIAEAQRLLDRELPGVCVSLLAESQYRRSVSGDWILRPQFVVEVGVDGKSGPSGLGQAASVRKAAEDAVQDYRETVRTLAKT